MRSITESSKFPRILGIPRIQFCSVECDFRASFQIDPIPRSRVQALILIALCEFCVEGFPSYRESTLESRNSAFLILIGLPGHSAQENFPIADFSSGCALQNRVTADH